MKKSKKTESSMSPLTLALIITGSIVAAAGIVLLLLKLCKKKKAAKVCECGCCDDLDDIDSWELDEDILGELELDDEEVSIETEAAPAETGAEAAQ